MKKNLLILGLLLISFQSAVSQEKKENLKINWPTEYKFKVGSDQDTPQIHMVEMIPKKESLEKWKIMGNMMAIKGAVNIPMDTAMNMMFQQAQKNSDNAKLSLVEKNENNWIIFKIEVASYKDDPNPESQLYYIIQGKTALYSSFVALKQAKLKDDFVAKWAKVFKESELVYE